MDHDSTAPGSAHLKRVVRRADKMVASGQLTAEEAMRLKAAQDPTDAEKVVRDIRARHAGERLKAAVAEGAMTRQQAEGILQEVRGGDHSRQLRSHLAKFRPRRRANGQTAPPASDPGAGEDPPT